MIEFGSKTIMYVKYLLKNHFSQHEGSWPEWYAGVILLYAGHLVLNTSSLKISKTQKLDFRSTSDNEVTDYYTLHCWHTDDFYSKFQFMKGGYAGRQPDASSLKCNEYCYDCISRGANHGAVLYPSPPAAVSAVSPASRYQIPDSPCTRTRVAQEITVHIFENCGIKTAQTNGRTPIPAQAGFMQDLQPRPHQYHCKRRGQIKAETRSLSNKAKNVYIA